MKLYVAIFISFISLSLFSCATGPVHMAMNESESIKSSYDQTILQSMSDKNQPLLHEIYLRLTKDKINIYKQGLGFNTLRDENKEGHYYLMVNIRPPEISFDEHSTKPHERFSTVLGGYFQKYLTYIKRTDIETSGVEGVSFGIYWPVRDYSQCKENGGFIEYIIVYLSRNDIYNIFEGNKTFAEISQDAEILASLNLEPAKYYKPKYQ
ncbi:MAG: hypothetical protein C0392_05940 [Syntrophus sp. (in: bacteria)]|nr:hypothetical protein [Syntrophus sp. (in: bacteria)]